MGMRPAERANSGRRAGRARAAPLLCLLALAGASLLALGGCGSGGGTLHQEVPTPGGEDFAITPVPTIGGLIGGCEIGQGAECPGADFSHQDLGEIIIGWRQLDELGRDSADLEEANLRGALFVGANLEGIRLGQADLREADFLLANLTKASLFGADASGANFEKATLDNAELKGATFSGANFEGASMRGADLSRADLSGAALRGVELLGAFLTYADLRGADLTDANLTFADMTGTELEGAILCNTTMADRKVSNEGCP